MKIEKVFVLVLSLIFISCQPAVESRIKAAPKSGGATTTSTPSTYALVFDSGASLIKLWKDGAISTIDPTAIDPYPRDLEVTDDGDVYIAGCFYNGSKSVASYWKNGVRYALTDGTEDACLNGISVIENTVYMWGYESVGVTKVAKYWTGNTVHVLDSLLSAEAIRMYKYGSNIYFVGYDGNKIVYWKNETEVDVTSGVYFARPTDILVSGADLYIAGRELNSGGSSIPKIWKNGVETLVAPSSVTGEVKGMAMKGTDLYAMMDTSSGAGLWKNGFILSSVDNTTFGSSIMINNLSRIFFYNSSRYVVGAEFNGTINRAKFWKEGVGTNVSDGASDSYAMDVVIK